MNTKRFTLAWLAEHGISHETSGDDFYESKIVRDLDWRSDQCIIVFEDEGRFWRLVIGFHPEDWAGTNDLKEWRNYPNHEFEAREVVQRMVPTWVNA